MSEEEIRTEVKDGETVPQEDSPAPTPEIVLAKEFLPEKLVIVPTPSRPLFPGMVVPMAMADERSTKSVTYAMESAGKAVGIVLLKSDKEAGSEEDLYGAGVAGKILKSDTQPGGQIHILINTLQRFRIKKFVRFEPYIVADVEYPEETLDRQDPEVKAFTIALIGEIKIIVRQNPLFSEEMKLQLERVNIEDPGVLADFSASLTNSSREELQEILETYDVKKRLEKVLILLRKEVQMLELQQKIKDQIDEKISKQQREYFLREQLKVIKKELGLEQDPKAVEIEGFRKKAQELKLPPDVRKVVDEEIEKLSLMESVSPEFTVSRNYVDWLTALPWGIYSDEILDLARARKILDEDHYGLDEVKERIVDFIAVRKLKKEAKGSILCFVGPPGVGKTSMGKSIARTLNRSFFRFSVGGMRDEAEIKGHRRTYIGAMPGKIIQGLKIAQTSNPVFMIDEIEKLAHDYRGDPASALLEVLDPEQNVAFLDHYLDVRFDLSHILFITTANILDTIPGPLLDRMEVLKLPGYLQEEKIHIAEKFLVPRQLAEHGLKARALRFSRAAISKIIDGYAREAGVRNLEKEIAHVARKVARRHAEGDEQPAVIQHGDLEAYIGRPKFLEDPFLKALQPGIALGLAWTALGGAVLTVEAVGIPSHQSGLQQTGQLGDVMVESSRIAYDYVKAGCKEFGLDPAFFEKHSIHLHVPAGATPKDGPSAGITMATAIYSFVAGKRIRRSMAMTGELTLTGRVLPVGGIKEKVLAAKRVKIATLIIPKSNEKDYAELPDYLKKGITFHLVETMKEVIGLAFP
jgi:ATP-dependent Lon protease